jgi:peptide/nickel transport system substrate-binding protein
MRTRIVLLAALAALTAVLAAGCGGSGDETAAPPPPAEPAPPSEEPAPPGEEPAPAPPAESEAPPSGEVQKGGLLRIGTTGEIDSINPFNAFNTESYQAFMMEYPVLVASAEDLSFTGDWAESWEVSEDGLVWTYHLRPGGQWSDGTPLTSADAVWTVETVLKYADGPTSLLAPFIANVETVEAPDEQTLILTYSTPIATELVLTNMQQFFILPAHVWSQYDTDNGRGLKQYNPQDDLPVVGAGPFVITEYEKKGVTIFEKNPGFYGTEPNVDAVGYQHFENEDAMIAAFQAGEVDYLEELPPNVVASLEADERFVVLRSPSGHTKNFIFNSNPNKPNNRELLDPKVREAFAHAMNRQEILDVVWAGNGATAVNIVTPYSGDWFNSEIVPEAFDLDLANQILDELGYARGSDGVRVVTDENGEHKMEYEVILPQDVQGVNRTFDIIQQGLAEVGVTLISNPLDGTTAFEEIGAPDWKYEDFDLAMWSWDGYVDPDFVLSVTTCAQYGGWSDTGYCNPEWDALYEEQGRTVDGDARRELVWQMQEMAFRDKPYIHLVTLPYTTVSQANWTGFKPQLIALSKEPWITPGMIG